MTSLAEALSQYGQHAYLSTVGSQGPHTSVVEVDLDGRALRFAVGRSAQRNAARECNVSLLWPAREAGGYSIIVNGPLTLSGENNDMATVEISKSVFHRPGPAAVPGGACASDCQPLSLD